MASTKAGGATKNTRDSNPKYLGVKRGNGQGISSGMVIVRQRGTKILPGNNVSVGKDHTLFAKCDGVVSFKNVRKTDFTGKTSVRKQVSVVKEK